MKDIIDKNRKYLIIILFGLFILVSGKGLTGDDYKNTSDDEKRFKEIISLLPDVKSPEVMITKNDEKEVTGVIIVTKNVLTYETQEKLLNATKAAFNTGIQNIVILP